ncbi:MAG TPA: hypothetical protein VEX35_03800 [Allosphingosinicella sp.]|nr:hypothetical protein [Allosphingosinicella sp.]
MADAYANCRSKRAPIEVRPREGGGYRVVDGNSTVCIAFAAGWPDVPCHIQEDPQPADEPGAP